MVYITRANLRRMVYAIEDPSPFDGPIYHKPIRMFTKKERQRLLAIRQLLAKPEITIRHYFDKVHKYNDDNRLLRETPPAYHSDPHCKALHSDFKGYKTPDAIKDMAEDDPSVEEKFKKWFTGNRKLLDEEHEKYNQRRFSTLLRQEFGITLNDIPKVQYENSVRVGSDHRFT
jgi:hypothetical protein